MAKAREHEWDGDAYEEISLPAPQEYWLITEARDRRKRNLWAHEAYLIQQTETWDGFASWLLSRRDILEEAGQRYLMDGWPFRHVWPTLNSEQVAHTLTPHPDFPFKKDCDWMLRQVLRLQRWREQPLRRNKTQAQWLEAHDHFFLVFNDNAQKRNQLMMDILREKAEWMQKTQQAWEDLDPAGETAHAQSSQGGTAPPVGSEEYWAKIWPAQRNRGNAILLLDKVFWTETYPEMLYGRLCWRQRRRARQTQFRRLWKTHQKAVKAITSARGALEQYRWAAGMAEQKLRAPLQYSLHEKFPEGRADKEGEAIEQAIAGLDTTVGVAHHKLGEAAMILNGCAPALTHSQNNPRGRPEKSALNTAIRELDKMYQASGHSASRILQHIHTLLYVVGICPDEEYQNLSAKFYQCRSSGDVPLNEELEESTFLP